VKSLGIFGNSAECSEVRELLASRGIPSYWAVGFRLYRGPLFVCINDQYEDALAVLKNPGHIVSQPVNVEEFERATQTQGLSTVLMGGIALLSLLSAMVGVLLALHFYG
jgi:hypothetical protein